MTATSTAPEIDVCDLRGLVTAGGTRSWFLTFDLACDFGGKPQESTVTLSISERIPWNRVYLRFAADKVQYFYCMEPYRPENLSKHEKLKQYYT